MNEPTVISIEEFRRITGFASDVCTDEQATELIRRLDTMAQIYIKQVAGKPKEDKND